MDREKQQIANIELRVFRGIRKDDYEAGIELWYSKTSPENLKFVLEINTRKWRTITTASDILVQKYKIERDYKGRVYISYQYGFGEHTFSDTLSRIRIPSNSEVEKDIMDLIEELKIALVSLDNQDKIIEYIDKARSFFASMEYT